MIFWSLQMEIGLVYLEQRHAYLNKWLLLSDEEAEMAGAKGYLKMCICVVGPGDDPPVFCFVLHDINYETVILNRSHK